MTVKGKPPRSTFSHQLWGGPWPPQLGSIETGSNSIRSHARDNFDLLLALQQVINDLVEVNFLSRVKGNKVMVRNPLKWSFIYPFGKSEGTI